MRCMRRVFASIVVEEPLAILVGQVAVAQRLGEAADHGERRLELVRHVGHEVAPNRLEAAARREVHDARAPRRRRAAAAP